MIEYDLRWASPDWYALLKDYARQNRQKPTEAEVVLWQQLRDRALGTKFFRQYIIADYIVDFVSLQHLLVIEVDGAYHSEPQQQVRDELRSERLERLGFMVIRFTNDEILNSIDQVILTIKSHINMNQQNTSQQKPLNGVCPPPSLTGGAGGGSLIDGKATAAAIKAEIKQEVEAIVAGGGKRPHLAAILVGHDGGSETYVNNKVRACAECGFQSTLIRFEDNITEEELLSCVSRLNRDNDIDGFIVQLPLPRHIAEQKVIEAIDYRKDVDGFHPINVGRMAIGLPAFVSATPKGILTLLRRYDVETSGKKCVILGRSNIVGKPMAQLMMQKEGGDATVTVCHSHSPQLKDECRQADIIIAAIGRPNFVTADMVKPGAVIIDVGTTRVPDATRKSGFRLNGDVNFDEVAPLCRAITPVPGGVGPMTICMLMQNTLAAARHEYYD